MCTVEDVVSGVAKAVSTFVTWETIYTEKQTAKAEAESLKKQAITAEEQAGIERQEGVEEARQKRLQAILRAEEQKTNIAAGNIAVSSEYTLNKIEDEKLNGELDALNIMKEADFSSQSYLSKAETYRNQAQLKSLEAKDKSPYFRTLFKNVSSFSSDYKKSSKRKTNSSQS